MPKIKLKALHCYKTEDELTDEIVVKINGNEVWGPTDMSVGDVKSLSNVAEISFTGEDAQIELWDQDEPDIYDDHDFLGTVIAHAYDAGTGNIEDFFRNDGAEYKIVYEVKI